MLVTKTTVPYKDMSETPNTIIIDILCVRNKITIARVTIAPTEHTDRTVRSAYVEAPGIWKKRVHKYLEKPAEYFF